MGAFKARIAAGAISARAEEPQDLRCPVPRRRGDLRAGGGTVADSQAGNGDAGRSPRGRRNLVIPLHHRKQVGAISARAEEPAPRTSGRSRRGGDLRAGGGTL